MRKLLIAIATGGLLLASVVTASAQSSAKSKTNPTQPAVTCTPAASTTGSQEKKETDGQNNQQGTQEGQTGNFEGDHQDTGAAASSNDKNDGEKETEDAPAGTQPKVTAGTKTSEGDLQEEGQCGQSTEDQANAGQSQTSASKKTQTGNGQSSKGDKDNSTGGTSSDNNRNGE